MKDEYDMSNARRNSYADKLPQLSEEQLRKLASGEGECVSEKTIRIQEDGEEVIIKETVISL